MTISSRTNSGSATNVLRALTVWLLSCIATSSIAQEAAPPLYEFHSPAAWVDVAAPQYDAPSPPGGVTDGAWVLMFDRQINVTAEGDESYEHFAVKVLNAVGVDAQSQIGISLDPTYQSLDIHALRVVRHGTAIDQRELARITALPEETELSNRIYNGNYNIDVLLSDVRAGDIIEYAYTVSSREQLFPGHYAARLTTAWSSPLHWQRIRILSPVGRPIRYRLSDRETTPPVLVRGDTRELVVEWNDVAAIPGDADRPGWYEVWPYLEVSDLQSWSDVSRLAAPLFAVRPQASNRVAEVASDVRAAGGTIEEQALHALQYVQDKIRYTSIAIGRGSHEPADPDTVLKRRFGDCKDKSLLLATILVRLGIDAEVALVHTTKGRALDRALPTPYAFNHAIVRARIGGQVFWLDPTASTRYSPLSTADAPDFERALLTDGLGVELEAIPRPASDTRQREVSMVFDLRAGIEEPATLEMTTWFKVGLADSVRPVLARGSPEQRELDYANYIARYYPGAKPAGPVVIDDDKAGNVIEIRERYALEHTFTADEDGVLRFYLHTDELYSYASPLESSVRQAPLALDYPVHIRQHIVVHLPEEWPVEPETVTVENDAFRYRSDVRYSDRTLDLTYEYEALTDHVELDDLKEYEADRTRFYDDTGYSLSYNPALAETSSIAPAPIIAMLLAFVLGVWAAIRWGYRYDPEPRVAAYDAPAGIGGWLLLPALGMVISPFLFGWLVYAWTPFIDADMWQTLPTVVREPYDGWAQLTLLIVLGVGVLLLVFSLLAGLLFFGKRTSTAAVFIAWIWSTVIYGSAVMGWVMLSGLDTETTALELAGDTIRDCVGTALWTAYMLKSKRVGTTFVKRLPHRDLTADALPATAA